MPRPRVVNVAPPERLGREHGLAYALFLPEGEPRGAVLILHGASSAKESHFDFARACRAHGFAALAFDARGHGESEGAMGAGVLDDVAAMAALLPEDAPLALRGSSMGGYLAIVGAERLAARALVAICPASAGMLRRGLRANAFEFRADAGHLDAFLAEHDEMLAAAGLEVPLLLLHAEGDERVPVEHSRELARAAPNARLIAVPGGHHRSVQHDGELQAETLRWLGKVL
ncbi:MAG TPA: alpha/beta fold hydrolase [Solirubrobacteraceae bacterium]|jgi:pimeloyl-ACP methyl ester carboxylesterase